MFYVQNICSVYIKIAEVNQSMLVYRLLLQAVDQHRLINLYNFRV